MKKILSLAAVCALFLGAVGLSSCNKGPGNDGGGLPAPSNLKSDKVTDISAELSWDAVQGAKSYTLVLNGTSYSGRTTNSYKATDLTPETDYTWSVKAVDANGNESPAASASFKTKALVPPPAAPTNLAVKDITVSGATFTWDAVEGVAGYEIRFNEGTPVKVTEATYTATNLSSGTQYTWGVRSLNSEGRSSEYTAGEAFKTTEKPISFVYAETTFDGDDLFGTGSDNMFVLSFFDFDPETSNTGLYINLPIITGTIDLTKQYIDLPVATYDIATQGNLINKIHPAASLVKVANGQVASESAITGGTMKISGDHNGYNIVFNLTFKDGTKVETTWEGPIGLNGREIALGAFSIYGSVQKLTGAEQYRVIALGGGVSVDSQGYFKGTGYAFNSFVFCAPDNSGETIPDGTYNIHNGVSAGDVLAGFENQDGKPAGLWLLIIENDSVIGAVPVKWGTITSSYSGGAYTMNIVAKTYLWDTVTATISGGGTTGGTIQPLGAPINMNALTKSYVPYEMNITNNVSSKSVVFEPRRIAVK